MSLEIRVALVSADSKFSFELRNVLSREFAKSKDEEFRLKIFSGTPSVEEVVVHYAPHLIIVQVETEHESDRLTFLDHLSRVSTRIPVVVTAANLEANLMLACVKKGVRDFMKQPLDSGEVHEMIARLLREPAFSGQERQLGVTYTFFSYKGGIGTTFLACNTAVALARLTPSRVLLWDLVIQNGDVPFFFDYDPQATLSDLIENIATLDENYIRTTLPLHSTGITILGGPRRPEEAESIRNDQIQQIHQTLRKYFDYIVIDAGHSLNDHIISALDISRYILLTTDLHLPVLKNTLRCLEIFERLGYIEGKFKVLLNRYNSKYEKFDLTKAQEILRYPIAFAFSNDYFTVSRSLNSGLPVADLDKNSVIAKEFDELARMLVQDFKAKEERGPSFIGKLFKGSGKRNQKKAEKTKEPAKAEPNPKEAKANAA